MKIEILFFSIEVIPSLNHLAMLKSIDVRDNLIKSTPNLLAGIGECKCVVVLKVLGNPVNNIPAIRLAYCLEQDYQLNADAACLQ